MYKLSLMCSIILLMGSSPNCSGVIKFSGTGGSLDLNQANSSINISTPISNFDGVLKIRSAAGSGDNVTSSNGNIGFNNGTLEINGTAFKLKGSYVPGTTEVADTITLNDGDVLDVFAGDYVPQTITVAAGASATIIGSSLFADTISVPNYTSTLNLGLNHSLNQSIFVEGGLIRLIDNLSLKDNVCFYGYSRGPGVDINGYTLKIGASTWNSPMFFYNAKDIQLNGNVTINGAWGFGALDYGNTSETIINGNGNTITFGNTMYNFGRFDVEDSHTLYIADAHIKFRSGSDFRGFNSKIVLSNVTLELSSDVSISNIILEISGDNVRIISKGTYTFTVTGASTQLNIDSVALYYEPLGGTNTSPFITTNGGTINTINGGVIRSTTSSVQPVDIVIDAAVISSHTITQPLKLTTIQKVVVANSAPSEELVRDVTIDGSNYTWQFPNETQVITIADYTAVTLTNVILDNFTPNNVLLGTGSNLYYGDNVVINHNYGNYIGVYTLNTPIKCVGNVTWRLNGHMIDVANNTIEQLSNNKTLTLDNGTLVFDTNADTCMSCKHYGATIVLKNVAVQICDADGTSKFLWDTGSLSIDGCSRFEGVLYDVADRFVDFDWTSNGTLTVLSGAKLEFGNFLNFVYEPTVSQSSDNTPSTIRRKFILSDPSSTLSCDGCKITASAQPLALDSGNLLINNKAQLVASTTDAYGCELGTSLNIELLAASILSIDGTVYYKATAVS